MNPGPGRSVTILLKLLPTFGRFVPIFFRFFPFFARFIPGFISYLINRTLRGWKARGLIENYETSIVGLGKLSYKINIRIGLTPEQAKSHLNDLLVIVDGWSSIPTPRG
jgi:hypothetical protein